MRRGTSLSSRFYQVEQPQVNLTPLIDVVFVILIMFIVVAPLLEVDQVELASGPTEGVTYVQDQSVITVHVRKDNSLWLNNKQITLAALTEFFVLARQQYPTATPQLFHDRNAPFGTYQAIKNAAESAGFDQMEVILSPSTPVINPASVS